jgi:hypothetical protein
MTAIEKEACIMKKYLLLIEDEKLWEKFKEAIEKDINTEILELIKSKISGGKK